MSTHGPEPWESCSNTDFLCQTFPNSVLTPPPPLPGFIHQPVPGVLITLKGSPRPGGPLCEFLSHDSQILSRAGLASSGQTGSALDWHLNTAGKSSGLCDMCSEQQRAQLGRTGSTISPREPNPPPARLSYPKTPHKRFFGVCPAHPGLASDASQLPRHSHSPACSSSTGRRGQPAA